MTRRARRIAVLVGVLALSRADRARADDSSVAAATVLFDEGIKLMDAGRVAEACPKLARSQSLAPSGGTLLALGECYEKTGRTASAWLAFREAAARAASAGKRDAEASALERAKRLEPLFSRLAISIPQATRVDGLEVKRDGTIVKEAELGVPVPTDPGPHEIVATAPRMKPFTKTISARAGETIDFPIPKLAPETNQPEQLAASPAEPTPDGSAQRVVGLAVAGAGVASLVTGGVFGLLAKSKNTEALKHENCPDATHCNENGLRLTDEAKSRALVATVLFVVGAGALAIGGVVFFTAPKASTTAGRIHVVPTTDLASAGATATVVW